MLCGCFSGTEQCQAQPCGAVSVSSGGGERVYALSGPLRSGVLNSSRTRDKTHESCGAERADDRPVEGTDPKEAWDTGGEIACLRRLPEQRREPAPLSGDERAERHHLAPPTGRVRLQGATQLPQWRGEPLASSPALLDAAGASLPGQGRLCASAGGLSPRGPAQVPCRHQVY